MTVTLTDKGQHVLSEATPVSWEIVKEVMRSFSEDDAVLLEKQLKVLRKNAHDGLRDIVRRSQPKPE
jgi:DNA-binding MarR family transcriptional regulator